MGQVDTEPLQAKAGINGTLQTADGQIERNGRAIIWNGLIDGAGEGLRGERQARQEEKAGKKRFLHREAMVETELFQELQVYDNNLLPNLLQLNLVYIILQYGLEFDNCKVEVCVVCLCEGLMKKTILITGGSQGIGKATAILAAQKGYCVIINYAQNAAAAKETVSMILKNGGQALAIQADISKEEDVLRMFEKIDKEYGYLDALVNNAGIVEPQMKVSEMNAERITKVLSTNVLGSFLCAREAVKRMSLSKGGKGGAIVNLSSIAARLGSPFEYVDYAASKGAIDTFTMGLSKEVAAEGIRVNCVRPGLIFTDIHAKAGEPNRVSRLETSIPMLRGGQPEEVAQAVLWLLSEEASYITGAFVDVAGGR